MKSKECKVVYEDIQTDIEIKATMFNIEQIKKQKLNRAKRKEATRRMAENYVER